MVGILAKAFRGAAAVAVPALTNIGLERQRSAILEKREARLTKLRGGSERVQQAIGIEGLGFQQLSARGEASLALLSKEDQAKVRQALEKKAERAAKAAGLKTKTVLGEELATKPLIEAEKEKLKQREKTKEAARKERQEVGIAAAKGAATLARSIELMQQIETGGIAAISLGVKRKLGLETADEGELIQGLMKSILRQLKPTFGGTFTAKEGDLLQDIEANISKSTESNIRLLNNLFQVMERDAKAGIEAAFLGGDETGANAIREDLEFRLDPDFDFFKIGKAKAPPPKDILKGSKFLGFE